MGQPQSGHSKLTSLRTPYLDMLTGQGANDRMRSPRARMDGIGDSDSLWNKLSGPSTGGGATGASALGLRLNRPNIERACPCIRSAYMLACCGTRWCLGTMGTPGRLRRIMVGEKGRWVRGGGRGPLASARPQAYLSILTSLGPQRGESLSFSWKQRPRCARRGLWRFAS